CARSACTGSPTTSGRSVPSCSWGRPCSDSDGGRAMATKGRPAPLQSHILREAEAITGGAIAIFLALSLLSFAPDAPRANLGGPVGHAVADGFLHALGVAAYLLPLYLGYLTVALLRSGFEDLGPLRFVGAGLLVLTVASFAGLVTTGSGRAVVHG